MKESATSFTAAETMRKIRSIKAKKCELCAFGRAPAFKRKMKEKKILNNVTSLVIN